MFYDNVKDLCSINRTTITQMAKDLGLSTSMPTKWKNGSTPKADTLKLIAEHFGVTTDQLLAPASRSNTVGNVSGSAVLQGNRGGRITVTNGAPELSPDEAELLRIFRALDARGRVALMGAAFDAEDRAKGGA